MTTETDPVAALLVLDAAIRNFHDVEQVRIYNADLDGPDPHITAAVRLRPRAQLVDIHLTIASL